ncbi:MAG: hypothetical protein ABIP61_05015 [Burkholderiaceae bacterium]
MALTGDAAIPKHLSRIAAVPRTADSPALSIREFTRAAEPAAHSDERPTSSEAAPVAMPRFLQSHARQNSAETGGASCLKRGTTPEAGMISTDE